MLFFLLISVIYGNPQQVDISFKEVTQISLPAESTNDDAHPNKHSPSHLHCL